MKYSCLVVCFLTLVLGGASRADQLEALVSEGSISYYRYFVTQKLLDEHLIKDCQILTFPPFSPPSALVLGKGKNGLSSYIIQRRFKNRKLWEELSQKLVDNKKDYFHSASVALILDGLNTEIEKIKKPISKEDAEAISSLCEDMILKPPSSADKRPTLDGVKVYLTTYVESGVQVKKYQGSDLNEINQLREKVLRLLKGAGGSSPN